MQQTDKKPILFWTLVIGIFLIVLLFWLPSFIASVRTLTDSIASKSNESAQDFEKNVTPQIDELKKTIDTLIKQIPVNAPPSSLPSEKTPEAALPKEGAPSVVPPAQAPAFPDAPKESASITPRAYCEGRKGINQSRSSQQYENYDVCIFSDGSECEQTMFQLGTCKEGQTQVSEDLMKTPYEKK